MKFFFAMILLLGAQLTKARESWPPPISSPDLQKKLKSTPPRLSRKYSRGPSLIYDCVRHHWACIDLEDAQVCRKNREKALIFEKTRLPCQNFKEFPSTQNCILESYKRVSQDTFKSFCYHPKNIREFTQID